MNEINLDSDEQKKLEASQQLESLREKRKENARKFKERRPHYSEDYYVAHRKVKVYTMKPNFKKEWIRETIIDPSKRDNRVLIDMEKYGKMKVVNIHEIQAKHYRDFKANLDQENESVIDLPKTHNKVAKVNKKKRKVVKTVKKNKLVKGKPLKAVGHSTKYPRFSSSETPVKSEPDLGCFPQLPLLDVDKFKNIQLLLHKIDDIEQVNKD